MKVGFLGVGNMGYNLLKAAVSCSDLSIGDVYVYDTYTPSVERAGQLGIKIASSEVELVQSVDIVILAVKPKLLPEVAKTIRTTANDKAVVSILAGTTILDLQAVFDNSTRLLSILPNLPVSVDEGVIGVADNYTITESEYSFIKRIFGGSSKIVEVDEKLLGVLSAISGSGPAFVSLFAESLADAGVKNGLPRQISLELAIQTLLGTAKLLQETHKHPAIVKDEVSSPGGTTICGVAALEDGGFRSTVEKAVDTTVAKWYK
ncbi:pyrroline-5-carboxylate reductase [Actinomycetota bacterium]|nr:pyrroline-5-carboxylate reductase [Actinomycetota bacterium]